MRTLTIRGVPKRLAEALEREKRRRGRSLNQTVLDVLGCGLGVGPAPRPPNGLAKLGGTWSDTEHREFESAIAVTEQIDDELWR